MTSFCHHLRNFNLPPGITTADLDPVDLDEDLERLYAAEDERGSRRRDNDLFETKTRN